MDTGIYKCFIEPVGEKKRPQRSKEEIKARIQRLQREGIPIADMDPEELEFNDPLMGYAGVEMWECNWDDFSKRDPRVVRFLDTLEMVESLHPRHALTVEELAPRICTTRLMRPMEKKYITSMSPLNIRGSISMEDIPCDIHRFLQILKPLI